MQLSQIPSRPSSLCSRAAAVAAALAVFAVHSPTAGAVAFPNSSSALRMSYMFDSGRIVPNLDTALKLARTHGLLRIDQLWQLGYDGTWDNTVADSYYDEMKAANPQLVIFLQLNPVYSQGASFPESWYMHNSAGHRLWNGTYKNYLMDPRSTAAYTSGGVTSSGWTSYLANYFKGLSAKWPGVLNGGAWFDDVGGTPYVVDAVTGASSSAVDKDGTTFTVQEWYDLTTNTVAQVQAAIGGARAGNALLSAYCYYTGCGATPATSWFFTANKLDDSMAEGYLRNWWVDPAQFYDVTAWVQSVQMLIDTNALGKYVQVTTALPTSATAAQIDQWRKYAYATYLLGNSGRAYFEFAPYGCNCWEPINPLYSLDIGAPATTASSASGYAMSGGWYERAYTKGKVLVNPGATTLTVPLGGTYLLPSGTSVTSVALAPHTGEILRLASSPSPPPPSPTPSGSNLLANGSFEGTLSGWGTFSATLSAASDGNVGSGAAKVSRAADSVYGMIASPAPLTSLTAGVVYQAAGYVRSATPGKQICLVLREKKTDGTLLYSTSCVTSTSSWQAFPALTRTVAGSGSMIDYYVYQAGGVAGDSFELDGLTLAQNLLANGSFDGTLSGWSTFSSSLSLASDGIGNSGAAKVTRLADSAYGVIATPAPLTSLTAGAVYRAGGYVRSATPGKQICLVLREKKTDGTLLYSTSCVTSTSSWQAFPALTRTVAGSGSLIDYYAYQAGGVAGESFELDGLTLTKG